MNRGDTKQCSPSEYDHSGARAVSLTLSHDMTLSDMCSDPNIDVLFSITEIQIKQHMTTGNFMR